MFELLVTDMPVGIQSFIYLRPTPGEKNKQALK